MNKTISTTLALVVIVVAAVTVGVFTVQNLNSDNDVVANPVELNIPERVASEEIDTSDWVEYRNEELGFLFRYPSIYGEAETTKTYGDTPEPPTTPALYIIDFKNPCGGITEEGCSWFSPGRFIIGATSPGYAAWGTSRPQPTAAGFDILDDGLVYSRSFGTQRFEDVQFKTAGATGILFTSYDNLHNASRTIVLFNLEREGATGLEFITYDSVGETANRDRLIEVASTFELIETNEEDAAAKTQMGILRAAAEFCGEHAKERSCANPRVDRQKENVASVETDDLLILVARSDAGDWYSVLGNSSDSDICMTGTNSPDLAELCN